MQQIKISDTKIYEVKNISIEGDKITITFEEDRYDVTILKTDFTNLAEFSVIISDLVDEKTVIQGEYPYEDYIYSSDFAEETDEITLSKTEIVPQIVQPTVIGLQSQIFDLVSALITAEVI